MGAPFKSMLSGLLLACATALNIQAALAQPILPQIDESLKTKLEGASVFLRFHCREQILSEPVDGDTALVALATRGSFATGTFVGPDGHVITSAHQFEELIFIREDHGFMIGCREQDVQIDGYQISNINGAIAADQGASTDRDFIEDIGHRNRNLLEHDVLIFKFQSFGAISGGSLCVRSALQRSRFANLPIIAHGVAIEADRPDADQRPGFATSEAGSDGETARYLKMTPAATKGMSGGPVVTRDGTLIGLVQGYQSAENPGAVRNHLVPQYRFYDALKQLDATCKDTLLRFVTTPRTGSTDKPRIFFQIDNAAGAPDATVHDIRVSTGFSPRLVAAEVFELNPIVIEPLDEPGLTEAPIRLIEGSIFPLMAAVNLPPGQAQTFAANVQLPNSLMFIGDSEVRLAVKALQDGKEIIVHSNEIYVVSALGDIRRIPLNDIYEDVRSFQCNADVGWRLHPNLEARAGLLTDTEVLSENLFFDLASNGFECSKVESFANLLVALARDELAYSELLRMVGEAHFPQHRDLIFTLLAGLLDKDVKPAIGIAVALSTDPNIQPFSLMSYVERSLIRHALRGLKDQVPAAQTLSEFPSAKPHIGASVWADICYIAALNIIIREAAEACNRGVELEDAKEPGYRYAGASMARGINRSLSGNLEDAAADFRNYFDRFKTSGGHDTRIALWIRALESGENPITTDTLRELRKLRMTPYGTRIISLF